MTSGAAAATPKVEIRPVRETDVTAIAEIEAQIRGQARPQYWRERLRFYLDPAGPDGKDSELCQVAVVDGKTVGFVLGDTRSEEFDLPRCGWIISIGVDPAYRNQRVGQTLVRSFFDYLAKHGMTMVRTMVGWDNAELLSFFGSLGFDCGPLLPLERDLAAPQPGATSESRQAPIGAERKGA